MAKTDKPLKGGFLPGGVHKPRAVRVDQLGRELNRAAANGEELAHVEIRLYPGFRWGGDIHALVWFANASCREDKGRL